MATTLNNAGIGGYRDRIHLSIYEIFHKFFISRCHGRYHGYVDLLFFVVFETKYILHWNPADTLD